MENVKSQAANINAIVTDILDNVKGLAEAAEATEGHIEEVYNVVEGVKESLEQIIHDE